MISYYLIKQTSSQVTRHLENIVLIYNELYIIYLLGLMCVIKPCFIIFQMMHAGIRALKPVCDQRSSDIN